MSEDKDGFYQSEPWPDDPRRDAFAEALAALDGVHTGRMTTWRRCVDAVRAVAGLPPLTDAEAEAHRAKGKVRP